MNKTVGVFYFTFSFEDEEDENGDVTNNTWGFNLTPEAIEILGEDFAGGDWLEEHFWDIEGEFGVHDWGTSPSSGVVAVGYHTYEVERSLAVKCVERWRQVFIEKVGAKNVSTKVYDLGGQEVGDDMEVFNNIKKLGG